jgi:hypothetical protein
MECDLATSDTTGRVSGGFIKITGRVLGASLRIENHRLKTAKVYLSEKGNEPFLEAVRHFNNRWSTSFVDLDYPKDYLSEGDDHGKQWEVLLVPIARVQRMDDEQPSVKEVAYALVLAKIDQDRYKRIGLAQEQRDSGIQRYIEEPAKMWQERPGCFDSLGTEKTVMVV